MLDEVRQKGTSRTFPVRWPVTHREDRPARIVEITDSDATEIFDSLSSETARALLSHLHDEPQTASGLSEQVDTSVQNVQYHLQKFSDAGLVEVVDTWYSARGNEMKVYSPADHSLVLYTGETPGKKRLRDVFSGGAVAIAILGIMSVLIDHLVRTLTRPDTGEGVDHTISHDPTVIEITGIAVTPGMLFFLGGLFLLALGTVWWVNN